MNKIEICKEIARNGSLIIFKDILIRSEDIAYFNG